MQAEAARLAALLQADLSLLCVCVCVRVGCCLFMQAEAARLAAWLQQVVLSQRSSVRNHNIRANITFVVSCTDATLEQLSAQLSVLRAVKFQSTNTGTDVRVKLTGRALSQHTPCLLDILAACSHRL